MKKTYIFLCAILICVTGFFIIYFFLSSDYLARYSLYRILQTAAVENADSVSDDGLTVYFKTEKTISFIEDALKSAHAVDITGVMMSTLPAPDYCVGNTSIGADGIFFSSFGNKQYAFYISSHHKKQLNDYTQLLLEIGSLNGIEK